MGYDRLILTAILPRERDAVVDGMLKSFEHIDLVNVCMSMLKELCYFDCFVSEVTRVVGNVQFQFDFVLVVVIALGANRGNVLRKLASSFVDLR